MSHKLEFVIVVLHPRPPLGCALYTSESAGWSYGAFYLFVSKIKPASRGPVASLDKCTQVTFAKTCPISVHTICQLVTDETKLLQHST